MIPNKEWIDLINDRLNDKYKIGIQEFLEYAFRRICEGEHIPCPCVKCKNACYGSREATQVFYVNDNINKGWQVAVKTQPRDLYDMGQSAEDESENTNDLSEAYQHSESFNYDCGHSNLADVDGQNIWRRTDLEPTVVDVTTIKTKRKRKAF